MNYANDSVRQMLLLGFEYDLWANLRWYNAIQLMKERQSDASAALQHILTAQRNWLERCGVAVEGLSRVATRSGLQEMNETWRKLLASRSLDDVIEYKNSRGQDFKRPLGEIAWHVMNHGTFHRGHIRGLAQAEKFDEFADTDLFLFLDAAAARS